ncbi:MAG: hypothetical protein FWE19_05930 [Oscillospiraceae bacterium]|nr:hypothetical protein [Oscillospiraceae bacterium]
MALESMVSAIGGLKHVLEIAKTVEHAEVRIALQGAILDAQQKAMEVQEENTRLKEQVKELEDAEYHHSAPIVYFKNHPNIPFCSTCWGTSKSRVKIFVGASFKCPACKFEFIPMALAAKI